MTDPSWSVPPTSSSVAPTETGSGSWCAPAVVVLVCGASGVGKSVAAKELGRRYAMVLAEVDDLVTALKVLTTRDQLPPIHAWADPPAGGQRPQQVLQHTAAIAELLAPALRAVIADHLAFDAPVILEGDYLLPELVEGFDGAVRAVLISENDTAQLATNFRAREPWAGEQHARAQVSALWDTELQARAQAVGVPIVPSRPWTTIGPRVHQALSLAPAPGEPR